MQLAEVTLPKINPVDCGLENLGGLIFCPLGTAVEHILPRVAGKALLISDAHCMGAFAPYSRSVRAISVVFEADALPLFSMPDGVGAVLAVGGAETIRAARFFAKVRRIPCALFPAEADLRGAVERAGDVLLCGKNTRVELAESEIYVDLTLTAPTLAEAFASLLLTRLALIEEHALRLFTRADKPESYEKLFALSDPARRIEARELIRRNFALRCLEQAGAPVGEGETLARLYREAGESYPVWRAFCSLAALYSAFFECGKPRKYFVPDYSARAEKARAGYWSVVVPSPEEYALRANVLERMRRGFSAELRALLDRKEQFEQTFRSLAHTEPPELSFARLRSLPEYCPAGLSAYIRDFGLMEF